VSRPAPFDTAEMPLAEDPFEAAPAVLRRRQDSARVRRRRLLLADVAIGVALGLLGLILLPGLAIGVLVGLALLAGCALAAAATRLRARRRRARTSPYDSVDPARLRARRGP
jgi:hypothetical protein